MKRLFSLILILMMVPALMPAALAAGTATTLDHEHYYESVITQPTCTEQGYTTHICECGDSYTDNYIAALGHREVVEEGYPATCTTTGQTDAAHCSRCGLQLREHGTIPATGHHYQSVSTSATCTEPGCLIYTCTACGSSYSEEQTPALGHNWNGLACRRCDAVRRNPFTDTDPTAFYFEPVLWAVENGITSGTSATTFSPTGTCQRAQVVTFLWRAMGCPKPTSTSSPFVDVKTTDYYYNAVLWAVENGITNGLDATHFGPSTGCNRAQVVTFLWRSVGSPVASAANPFSDVKPGAFYYDAVLWAVDNGITNGLSATQFGIGTTCNRAQIVTFLYRTFAK